MNIQKIHDQLDKIQKQPRSKEAWKAFKNLLKETTIQEVLKATSEKSLTDLIQRIIAIKEQNADIFLRDSFADVQGIVGKIQEDPNNLFSSISANLHRNKLDSGVSSGEKLGILNALNFFFAKFTPSVEKKTSDDKAKVELVDKLVPQDIKEPLSDYELVDDKEDEETKEKVKNYLIEQLTLQEEISYTSLVRWYEYPDSLPGKNKLHSYSLTSTGEKRLQNILGELIDEKLILPKRNRITKKISKITRGENHPAYAPGEEKVPLMKKVGEKVATIFNNVSVDINKKVEKIENKWQEKSEKEYNKTVEKIVQENEEDALIKNRRDARLQEVYPKLLNDLAKRKKISFDSFFVWFSNDPQMPVLGTSKKYSKEGKRALKKHLKSLLSTGIVTSHKQLKTTYYEKGPHFNQHTDTPEFVPSGEDNVLLAMVYPHIKNLGKEVKVYHDIAETLEAAMHDNNLNEESKNLVTTAYEKLVTNHQNYINPYSIIALLAKIRYKIPVSIRERKKTLEKTFLTTMRDEEVVAKQETIKTHLLEKFGGDSMEETLATKYINEQYKKNNLPKTYETLIKTRLLEKFKETLFKDEQGTLPTEADFLQKAEDDVRTACMEYGLCMIAEPRTLNEGKLDDSKHSPLDAKAQFAQALELKKLAHSQKEFLEEQEDTGLHLNSAQKKPKEYALTHGSWFKNVVGSVKRFLVDFFSIDTPTAKEKKYPDTLPKKYLQACPKSPYKRTCPNNSGEVFVDGFAGTITHKYADNNPITVGINREKPEETMQQLASSTAFGGEPTCKYVLQALIQAYAEKLIDNDGPQKFTNILGEECIISMGINGSVSIEKNGSRMAPLGEGHNAENYQQLLEYRSHIKSAIEQYVPLEEEVDEEVHGSITGITNTTPVSSAYMAKNGILPAGNFSVTVSNDILKSKGYKTKDANGNEINVDPVYETANTINIDSRYSLASLSSPTSHEFKAKTGLFDLVEGMFIKFPTKVVRVEKIDSKTQGTVTIDRYKVFEEYESLEKLSGEIDINKYFDQELNHMIASNAEPFTQMQPLVSFIIPVNNTTDPSQIFYYNPLTDERFKGQDQDGHPGVSAVDLGDFADDIYAGSTEKRGKNLAVSVKAFATNKKGVLDADNNFVWESTGKDINSLQKAHLPKDQLPKVLQSTQAKKAIDGATKKLLSSLG